MQIPVRITFHGVTHSDAVEQYVRARAEKLRAVDARVVCCRVAVEQPRRHSRHGEHFRIRIDIALPGGEIVVERLPNGDHAYGDVHAAIDAPFDHAMRRVHDYVRRQRGDVKEHNRARQGVVAKQTERDPGHRGVVVIARSALLTHGSFACERRPDARGTPLTAPGSRRLHREFGPSARNMERSVRPSPRRCRGTFAGRHGGHGCPSR